jgi:hypothetical protein
MDMKKIVVALACALSLAACDRSQPAKAPAAPETPEVEALAQPTAQGRELHCHVTYTATRGPLVSESDARVNLIIENGVGGKGWTVTVVEVVHPLPDAQGFDPWLAFLPNVQRTFVVEEGSAVTLAMTDGAPMTLNRVTGELHWRAESVLGETSYKGGCR